MNHQKIIEATDELVKVISKSSATISDKNVKVEAERWIDEYHQELTNALSGHPKAVSAIKSLSKAISNQRLVKKRWLKNLGIVRKALNGSKLTDSNTYLFDPSKPFTAYQVLKGLFSKAKKEVIILDGYVEEGALDILSSVSPKTKIKLLTNNTYGKFMRELPKFKKEFLGFEARKSSVVHDRFFMIDGDYYISGTSLHSLGGKKSSYIFRADNGIGEILKSFFDNIWVTASKL
jgi:hypothetical protein